MKLSNVSKILFITLSNIGDAILTLPVLSALRDNFPEASIDVVVGPRPQEIFKKDPRINVVFVYDKHAGLKDKITFIKKLKAEKYDLAIDMKASFLPVLIGAKYGEVLGVHILGNPSGEIIYGASMAIEMEMTIKEMEEVIFPHPTISEIFKETIFSF